MNTSTEIKEIFTALIKAQSKLQHAKKESENPFFHSKYADLATVIDTTKPALMENGLMVIQSPTQKDGQVGVTTRIIHTSGQWIEDTITFEIADKKPQAIGSVITYGRRYALAAMLGISQEDDDGNAGSGKPTTPPPIDDKDKKKKEALDKLNALPDDIKTGFDLIKYNDEKKYVLCNKSAWDHAIIRREINLIADSMAVK